MASDTLRLGVIGLGMGRGHARAYQQDPHCQLVALADADPERLQNGLAEFDVKKGYTDGLEMLKKEQLDAVSIALPNKLHHPFTLAAIEAGCHVLCEKPMAMTLAQATEMRDAAVAAGKTLAINFSFRFNNMSYALKQQVEAGTIGDIYFGRTVWHRRRGLPKFGGWFGQKALSGGGPLIDLGVHRLDLALWLMGHPEPVSVCGSTYDVIASDLARQQGVQFDVEDLAAGVIKFANGATLILEASWALQINQQELMTTNLYGRQGAIVQKNVGGGYEFTAEVYTEEGGNFYTKVLDAAVTPAPSAYLEFTTSLREGRPPVATADDGVRVQKVLEGMYQSAATGREVRFD